MIKLSTYNHEEQFTDYFINIIAEENQRDNNYKLTTTILELIAYKINSQFIDSKGIFGEPEMQSVTILEPPKFEEQNKGGALANNYHWLSHYPYDFGRDNNCRHYI